MDNWRAGYREDELAGKNRTQEKKADNWRALSREGRQLAGK